MNEQQLYMYCLQNEFNPRTSKFRTNPPFQDPGICKDKNVNSCKAWADAGECEKNPIYMKGSGTQGGMCRKSCGACEECAENDTECFLNNRRRLGYLPGYLVVQLQAETAWLLGKLIMSLVGSKHAKRKYKASHCEQQRLFARALLILMLRALRLLVGLTYMIGILKYGFYLGWFVDQQAQGIELDSVTV
eukprot:1158329-Pelagomonas_calceolata.AAC.23